VWVQHSSYKHFEVKKCKKSSVKTYYCWPVLGRAIGLFLSSSFHFLLKKVCSS